MIIGLPTGSYKVQFSGNNTNYISQWYDNKTSQSLADPVAVTAGVTTSNINATMILGDAIYGMVSDSTGGGITGVNVGAYDAVNDSLIGSVLSQFDGSYTIYGLPDGSYKVKFSINGYRSQWYNNKTSQALADIVPVVNEEAAYDINATMTNNYTVSFNSNGGSTVASQSVAYNTVASTPTTPTQTGTTFVGWYSDSALTTVFVFTTPITADTTLYAKWAVLSTYTVTYNGNTNTAGTAPIDSSSYLAGATVTVLAPGSLSKTGYTFSGWNTTANGTGTNYSAGTTFVIFDNINLFAQFYNVGDCDKNGTVTIDEVQSAINMFLGLKAAEACVDRNGSGSVSIAEVQKVINSFLGLKLSTIVIVTGALLAA